jgi:HEAT repeat protein
MKNFLVIGLLVGVTATLALQAEVGEEARFVAVIQSAATAPDKEDACRRLKQIGTAKAVPVLATLLGDEHLYQAACDALQTMPGDEAGEALQAALKTTSGKSKAGIIHSLGERRQQQAVTELASLLNDSDPLIATLAARALGEIGGKDSARVLNDALKTAIEPARGGIVDGLLRCATQYAVAGERTEAERLFQEFDNPKEEEHIRAAAFAGLIRTAADGALDQITSAIAGNDAAHQIVALQLAREVQNPKATAAFTNLLAKAEPALQAALLGLLQQRGDPAATPAILPFARSEVLYLRLAAITALGTLGDATMIPTLANAAISKDETEQKAARRALIELHRGNVGERLVAELADANPAVQAELARAMAGRAEKSAVGPLLALARSGSEPTRRAAIRALSQLADGSHLVALVKLIEDTNSEAAQAEVRGVFESIVDRSEGRKAFDVSPIVKGLSATTGNTRVVLLQVSALFADETLRAAMRAALTDPDPRIRNDAARAICSSRDVRLMPDELQLARTATKFNLRILALEGYVRLVNEESSGFSPHQRVELLKPAYALATRAEEKRLVLAALTSTPHRDALKLAEGALAEPEVKAEAEVACAQITKALVASDPDAAEASLRRLAADGSSSNVRTNAQALLKQLESGWLVAGPYRQPDKTGQQLFDVAFAPEQAGTNVENWRRAPGSADPTRQGEVVLDSVVGGNDCVVYLKTRVYSPIPQGVKFEIGSDDGIKLWVNGELVHANNAIRGLAPGQDRAKGSLRQGWNDLLAKVTQVSAGCGMILRITDPAGAKSPGLRFEPRGAALAPGTTGFRKIQISDQFYAEGAYYADFNRDGKLDVVAGPFWFEGPDFKAKHEIRTPATFSPKDYSDNFLTYTADFNGDGWPDVFYVPFPGKEGYWYENPGTNNAGHWSQHLAYAMIGNESPIWCDVTGDGQPDLILNNEGFLGYATFDVAKPNEPWTFHAVSPPDKRFQRFTHGIGAGDINGDGRKDLVEATGWWEQPANLRVSEPWKFHPSTFAEAAAQILVTDVDGDGLVDVITAWHCHLYGLVWYRQTREADGKITWKRNTILQPKPDLKVDELRFSEPHALDLVDMNGDGLKDFVTGKRFWAHGPAGDVEPNAPAVLYWFESQRQAGGKATFVPHLIDDDSGVGTQVTTVDLNGDGRPDVIVANKKGIFAHLSEVTKQ